MIKTKKKPKTFRLNTILNSDDIYITKDRKQIVVTNISGYHDIDKKGRQVVRRKAEYKRYPNTARNRNKVNYALGKNSLIVRDGKSSDKFKTTIRWTARA